MDDSVGVIKLPGFGLPIEQESSLAFANGETRWAPRPITLRERLLVQLSCILKDKPDWQRKVFDDVVVSKWKAEALAFHGTPPRPISPQSAVSDDERAQDTNQSLSLEWDRRQLSVSQRMVEYLIQELRDDASASTRQNFTPALDLNATVNISDTMIDQSLRDELRAAVARLENIPESKKDWHPGSDDKVLDIVHPSLFPLIYGTSKILKSATVPLQDCSRYIGHGETVPEPVFYGDEEPYSDRFQWLPCDLSLDADGNAKIESYINNLHPSGNERLYGAIERIITKSIPLWVDCVTSTLVSPETRMEDVGTGYIHDERPEEDTRRNDEEEAEDEAEDEDYDDYWDPNFDGNYIVPEPVEYSRDRLRPKDKFQAEAEKIQEQIKMHGFQVIVKLANIHLTPSSPTYAGGSWHIEGKMNERICASALYYYDSDNITDSYLAFREGVDRDVLSENCEQHRYDGICDAYGIRDSWGEAIQFLGKVLTRQDRLLAFPNVLQHRVSPFKLADATRPGHRKLLALFLVDPFVKIPSTKNVPPQQAHWFTQNSELGQVLGQFPPEIADQIVQDAGFPITMEEAFNIREELMDERRANASSASEFFRDEGYCFCEH